MRVAIKTGSTFGRALIDEKGQLTGTHSGLSIVRRLLKLFDDPILIVDEPMEYVELDGFDAMTLGEIDVNQTLVINMDVVDSLDLYRRLRRDTWRLRPTVMNLVWWNVSEFRDDIDRRSMAASFSTFPTFCNSQRTQMEVHSLVARHCTPAQIAETVRHTAWANLGIEMPKNLPAQVWAEGGAPVVAYPAMWLFARKRPQMWAEIVGSVAKRVPLQGWMRLHNDALTKAEAVGLTGLDWLSVRGLAPTRDDWWLEAAAGDVFLATSEDESYGLQYLELLWAGQLGVFPDRPWATNILPPGYPLLYENKAGAETMMHYALARPADAALAVERAFGGDMAGWLVKHHSKSTFDDALVGFVNRMIGDREEA
jgi:hypothetical protein